MSNTKRIRVPGAAIAAGFAAILTVPSAMVPSAALAQSSQPIDQRKALYAPWSPDQMAQRRKEYGLIGPGTTRQVPPPAFPSYLKKPESVEAADAAGARGCAPDRRPHATRPCPFPASTCSSWSARSAIPCPT